MGFDEGHFADSNNDFLFSYRRTPADMSPPKVKKSPAAATPSPPIAESTEPPPAVSSPPSSSKPAKRKPIGKANDVTPRASPGKKKSQNTGNTSSRKVLDNGQEYGPAVSRRPGASSLLMETTVSRPTPILETVSEDLAEESLVEESLAEITLTEVEPSEQPSSAETSAPSAPPADSPPPEPVVQQTEGGPSSPPSKGDVVPSTWKPVVAADAKHRKSKSPPKEVSNVKVKKKGKMGGMFGSKKSKGSDKPEFEPRAALAYYGTIGGGFGTPRLGVALGQFNVPAWVTVRPSGELVVSSTFANEVQLLSARGGPKSVIMQGPHDVSLLNPQGLAVSTDGSYLFVCDGGNDRVHRFNLDASGGVTPAASTDTAELSRPQGLVLEEGALFVASSGKNQIAVIDGSSLRLLFTFGTKRSEEPVPEELSKPSDLAVYRPQPKPGQRGPIALLYIVDMGNHRIAIFTTDGEYVNSFGQRGTDPGQFYEPLGIAVREEKVFVAEGIGARLQVLEPDGTPLLVLPAPTGGRLVGISWYEHRLYVSEIEAHRIHVFKIID